MLNQLPDIVKSHINNYKTQMFTSLPVTIVSYDPDTQTASVQPVMLEPYTDGVVAKMAQIDYVPVVFLSGGGGSLTFPVQVGDEGLVTFSSRNFDVWWSTGETDKISSSQRFNAYTDATVLVGLRSSKNSLQAPTDAVQLSYDTTSVSLKAGGKLEVSNSQEELISLLSEVVEECSKILTPTAAGLQPPANAAAFTALKARLDTFKT